MSTSSEKFLGSVNIFNRTGGPRFFRHLWRFWAGNSLFDLIFRKKCFIRSRVCCLILIRSALESPDPGASDSGSSLLIRRVGADLVTFEVVELSHYCGVFYQWISRIWSYPPTSKVTRSASSGRITKFDPLLGALESGLSSALRIITLRQRHGFVAHFSSKIRQNNLDF